MQRDTVQKVVNAMGDVQRERALVDQQAVAAEFARAVERTPGISMLLLTTADGRALADWSTLSADPRRLSAMTNSFLTLGETVAKELGLASADYATIATRQGNMVLIRIEHARPLTLAAMATFDTNAAVLLFAARDCAARIKALLPA
ncbi:roadblock/LC7 domain-containing protein [Xanthomonas sp. XNM01]|uniref:roadblock/LC7 domain-containing protein n=1 Tax=Xanthomonas sp. XNM01 TaxID=2769289 RepID=UPI00178033BE|nr:roadblock/LC7 domain-containing protein [Xanthomonas sp. XNM01]